MARIHSKGIYILVALGALFGALFLLLVLREDPGSSSEARRAESDIINQSRIIAGDTIIPVTVADTPALRNQGLSGTKELIAGTGKLFIFDTSDVYGFWMKDMRYPIDIVWIDESWRVVGVTEAADPASYPTVFYPPVPVRYVLEVNAHEARVDNLVEGTELQLKK